MDAQFSVASLSPFPLQDIQGRTVCNQADALYYLSDISLALKGAYDQMTCTSSNHESPWIFNQPESSTHSSSSNPPASFNSLFFNPEALRFPGDGLEFRRPVMSGPPQNVIDLTEDSSPVQDRNNLVSGPVLISTSPRATRPPHFPRNIIDLEESEDGSSMIAVRDDSPEIEFVSSRPLPSTVQNRSQSSGHHRGRRNPESIYRTRPQQSHHDRPTPVWLDLGRQVARVQQSLRNPPGLHPLNALLHRDDSAQTPPHSHFSDVDIDTIFVNTGNNMVLPGDLDFSTQGFTMGDVPRPPPPPPTYDAPCAPREGFTRSPREDDVLICPNCEEELGTGDDESKRQVWVIKSCGHVCQIITGLCHRY